MNTIHDAANHLQTAVHDLLYLFCRRLGVIWLAKKLPFMELRPQYKLRDEHPELMESKS